jgi:hypothetical protein
MNFSAIAHGAADLGRLPPPYRTLCLSCRLPEALPDLGSLSDRAGRVVGATACTLARRAHPCGDRRDRPGTGSRHGLRFVDGRKASRRMKASTWIRQLTASCGMQGFDAVDDLGHPTPHPPGDGRYGTPKPRRARPARRPTALQLVVVEPRRRRVEPWPVCNQGTARDALQDRPTATASRIKRRLDPRRS